MTWQEAINSIINDDGLQRGYDAEEIFNKTYDRVFANRKKMWDGVRPKFIYEAECTRFAIDAAESEVHCFLNSTTH